MVRFLLEPGLFSNDTVRTALLLGALVSIVSGVVGVFTVLRGQSFAGHALTDVATAGGAGASLAAWSPLVGFIGGGVIGAGAMDAIGVQRVKDRDVATGVVLGAATGLSALFLYLITLQTTTTGSTQSILFGSVFTVAPSTVPDVLVLSAVVLAGVTLIRRPLLMSSISPELAAARGVPLRVVGLIFMVMLAAAVGLSAIVIGSILSTALLIGPPASALRVATRLSHALVLACALGVAATWLGVVFAYDSYYWLGAGRGLPVSFFVVADVAAEFVVVSLVAWRRRHRTAAVPESLTFPEQVGWV
ncbi:MAG: metal ABC transporter permease [Acidimicrobiales bacterium]